MEQVRMPISELETFLAEKVKFYYKKNPLITYYE